MVRVLIGDMFHSEAQTLVNTVNCVGVMGKGIALEFKKRFPDMFRDYEARCKRKEVSLGRPYVYKTVAPPWILNFPTKDHWRSVTNLGDIVRGLAYLLDHYKEWGITSIAVPPLGCGYGQLEWRVVGPTLYRCLSKMDIPVELYAPHGTRHEELRPEFLAGSSDERQGTPPRMPQPQWIQPSWVALVQILRLIEQQPYRHFIGRTIFQKIAFVATMIGLPTGLTFVKKSYGPFSDGMKKIYARLINNGLIEEEHLAKNAIRVSVGHTYADAQKGYADSMEQWQGIIDKTADLFLRLDTRQAEAVATVLYAAQELKAAGQSEITEKDILESVLQWKIKRRPPLQPEEVAQTIRHLGILSWIKVRYSADMPVPEEKLANV